MMNERTPHDSAYKNFFSNPEMVESLLRDFVPADFIRDLDFSTLERCSASYVTDDLRERHDDIVWRVSWKNGSWCYVVLLIEFQSTPDYWMALRILSYTTLLLLDLVKSGNVSEYEGLPSVFPIVIYNGGKAWKSPQEVAELFAPMPESLKFYRPQQRHFLLDESRVSKEELDKSEGLVAQLLKLERAQNLEQVRDVVKELLTQLRGAEYVSLRRAFSVWLGRVVFKRSGITQDVPEFQDLQEVDAMLEERAAQWKNEYITLGLKEGEAKGLGRGVQLLLEARFGALPASVTTYISSSSDSNTLQKMMLSAYHAESLQSFIELIKKN